MEVAVPRRRRTVTVAKEALKDRLARYRQIKISVVGRKSGKTISIPVWFVLEGKKVYLLPMRGSETQWYKNVLSNCSQPQRSTHPMAGFWALSRLLPPPSDCHRVGRSKFPVFPTAVRSTPSEF
jgi:hypothetical protein